MQGNLMSVLLRAARVRVDANTTSDACSRVGSLRHILQVCPNACFNNVVELVASKHHKKGWSLLIEAAIPTPAGVRRPDLVIHGLRKTAYVIDATIVADNADLYGTHLGKVNTMTLLQLDNG